MEESVSTFGSSALSPTSFLKRSGAVHGDRVAVVEDGTRRTYADLLDRSRRLAGGLRALGVDRGDRVSILAPNSSATLEAHFGVPWSGGILNALNNRLSPDELAYIIDHAESAVLIADRELEAVAREAIRKSRGSVQLVLSGTGDSEYEHLVTQSSPEELTIDDENSLLALNYTSGTTGRPKGVMYSHRGAYLQALAMASHIGLDARSRYLWTLPMFHCNGWCFPWAVTATGSRHVLIRRPDPDLIWDAIAQEGVTHFSAAPTVLLRATAEAPPGRGTSSRIVHVTTGGSPPSPTLLARLEGVGLNATHLYGLTETYGPAAICDWRPEWDDLDVETKAALKARQGVANIISQPIRVWSSEIGVVPHDGITLGEIQLQGNNVMIGYYKDPDATAAASCDGWFRTGDIGVVHPDGYVELRDRSKDIIISGGENITSVDVEQALDSHPAVLESAVVGAPDDEWGELVVAFVTLAPGAELTERELIHHVQSRIARFKAPRRITFGELPKTGTGKIQKYRLREEARGATHTP
jgi:fatty-acyl-CoA synthase